MVSQFLECIHSIRVPVIEVDMMAWRREEERLFSVNSCTCFFVWESTWKKILTIDQLIKRCWSLINRCSVCKMVEETVSCFLIHCDRVRLFWNLLLKFFVYQWVLPRIVKDLLSWHVHLEKRRRKVWRLALICLFWCLWKEREGKVFKDKCVSDQTLKDFFVKLLE